MLVILAATRVLEGASSAASVPSILGYIAMATAGNEVLRGKTSARFEAATLAGLGLGAIVGVKLFEFFENLGIGPAAFFLNAAFYGVSFLIYKFGRQRSGRRGGGTVAGEHVHVDRYLALVRSSHVRLLAPTWIAINAAIGVWLSQSVFQLAKGDPRFPNQVLMGGFTANQITIGAIIIAAIFGAGLHLLGQPVQDACGGRRSSATASSVVRPSSCRASSSTTSRRPCRLVAIVVGLVAAGGLFVLAGATPAAIGLLADMSERFPTDRGAIMGLYSVFLAIGQITGSA